MGLRKAFPVEAQVAWASGGLEWVPLTHLAVAPSVDYGAPPETMEHGDNGLGGDYATMDYDGEDHDEDDGFETVSDEEEGGEAIAAAAAAAVSSAHGGVAVRAESKGESKGGEVGDGGSDDDDDDDRDSYGPTPAAATPAAAAVGPASLHWRADGAAAAGEGTAAGEGVGGGSGVGKAAAYEDEEDDDDDEPFATLSTCPLDHFYKASTEAVGVTKVHKEWQALKRGLPRPPGKKKGKASGGGGGGGDAGAGANGGFGMIVRAFEDRSDLLRALIVGPEGTPYVVPAAP